MSMNRGAVILVGVGTPESLVTGPIGALYLDQYNGAAYVKTSVASVSTGWVKMDAGGSTPTYTDTSRPDPTTVAIGTVIFNTDDGFPNWSDGTNWVDSAGLTT